MFFLEGGVQRYIGIESHCSSFSWSNTRSSVTEAKPVRCVMHRSLVTCDLSSRGERKGRRNIVIRAECRVMFVLDDLRREGCLKVPTPESAVRSRTGSVIEVTKDLFHSVSTAPGGCRLAVHNKGVDDGGLGVEPVS